MTLRRLLLHRTGDCHRLLSIIQACPGATNHAEKCKLFKVLTTEDIFAYINMPLPGMCSVLVSCRLLMSLPVSRHVRAASAFRLHTRACMWLFIVRVSVRPKGQLDEKLLDNATSIESPLPLACGAAPLIRPCFRAVAASCMLQGFSPGGCRDSEESCGGFCFRKDRNVEGKWGKLSRTLQQSSS